MFTASASSVFPESDSKYGPEQAIDGIRKEEYNFWHSAENRYDEQGNPMEGEGEWIQVCSPNPIRISACVLTPRQDELFFTRSPRDFSLLASTNETDWETLYSTSDINWDSQASQVFVLPKTSKAFVYFRLVVHRVGNPDSEGNRDSVQISEWKLVEPEPENLPVENRVNRFKQRLLQFTVQLQMLQNELNEMIESIETVDTTC
jgi:hypothetical protein